MLGRRRAPAPTDPDIGDTQSPTGQGSPTRLTPGSLTAGRLAVAGFAVAGLAACTAVLDQLPRADATSVPDPVAAAARELALDATGCRATLSEAWHGEWSTPDGAQAFADGLTAAATGADSPLSLACEDGEGTFTLHLTADGSAADEVTREATTYLVTAEDGTEPAPVQVSVTVAAADGRPTLVGAGLGRLAVWAWNDSGIAGELTIGLAEPTAEPWETAPAQLTVAFWLTGQEVG